MSQQRVRKPSGAREVASIRTSLTKSAGDTAVPSTRPNINEKNKSKKKIPKSMRYDLESALVGLCDVWFGDIKPHLMRNNIKLHVDGTGAIGLTGCKNGVLPAAAPGCSHLDPGAAPDHQPHSNANSANCCSMQRTVSKAQCPKLTVGVQTRHPPSLSSPPLPRNSTSQNNKSKQRSNKLKPNKRQTSALVTCGKSKNNLPRASRTCNFLPSSSKTKLKIRTPEATKNQPFPKYTKSHQFKQCQKVVNNRDTHKNSPQTRQKEQNVALRNEEAPSTKSKVQRIRKRSSEEPILFDSGLVDIIAQQLEKREKLLYRNPAGFVPAAFSLVTGPLNNHNVKARHDIRNPPWK